MSQKLTREEVERFFDGEFSLQEMENLAPAIEQSIEAQAYLQSLKKLHQWINDSALEQAEQIDSESLFASIEREIQAPALQVVQGGKATSRPSNDKPSPYPKPTLWKFSFPIAIAAAIFLTWLSVPNSSTQQNLIANVEQKNPAPKPSEQKAEEQNLHQEDLRIAALLPTPKTKPGSEVLAVDFGQNSGTVFTVEGEDEPTTVVWIEEFN